jgi:regulator of protease activity HflC (stomatin/prohibitin superfamily)
MSFSFADSIERRKIFKLKLFLIVKAEQLKQAAVITAEGDSKAAELIAKALIEAGDGKFQFKLKKNTKLNK